MSSILLSSPFPTLPPSSAPATEQPTAVAVAPVGPAAASSGKGDATSYSGSGTGKGGTNQGDTVALFQNSKGGKWARPATATGGSIVNAQAQEDGQIFPFNSNLPKVEMPDPLPTSPFLKQSEFVA